MTSGGGLWRSVEDGAGCSAQYLVSMDVVLMFVTRSVLLSKHDMHETVIHRFRSKESLFWDYIRYRNSGYLYAPPIHLFPFSLGAFIVVCSPYKCKFKIFT